MLWQHNANPSSKLASFPRYDDIVRTAGWRGLRASPAGDARRLPATGGRPGGAPKTARRIREAGAAGPPATGRRRRAFSTLLRQSGMRASTGGVLATKSERKMSASTCLYSLYAWLHFAWVVYDAKCIVVTRVGVSVCVSVRGRMPTLLHGPGCNFG